MNKQNKIALITGASRGIGKAVAVGLARDGYQVCLLSRTKENLQSAANEIIKDKQSHFDPLVYECDVSDINLVNKAVDDIINKLGHIDLLFNNAGIWRQGTLDSVNDFNEQLNINLTGAFNILQAVVPHMKKRKSGYIFNVSSIAGKIGYADMGAYVASKFGLVGLSESLFNELAPHNIKVTAICPSYVATDMTVDVEGIPQDLMIHPDDILQVVRGLSLLSSQACVKEITVDCRAKITGE